VKNMKKTILFPMCLGLLLVIIGVIGTIAPFYLTDSVIFGDTQLKTFSSLDELKNFLNASSNIEAYYYTNQWGWRGAPTLSSAESALPALGSLDYSTTNIQVEGVDEADIVKTDGEYIYIISSKNVKIIKAYPASQAEILSQIEFSSLKGLFIQDNKLLVFEELSPYEMYPTFRESSETPYVWRTFIKVYDVTDRRTPILTRNVSLDGTYSNSRMIGDYVYAIITQQAYRYVYQPESKSTMEVNLPKIYSNDQVAEVPATQIYYSNVSDRFDTYTHVVAINVLNDFEEPTHKTFLLGWASAIYVSPSNLYITYSSYGGAYNTQGTIIHRIRVQDGEINYQATGEVPGYVLNQFSMDEYNQHFRIATTTGQVWGWGTSTSQNHVYILNLDLDIVGRLENLAPGEKIYSARFMGERGYLVTFKKIDPLFVLDLSEPSDPRVLGQLKITGYSDYLHPYDETHIIGIGKETVEAEEGDFAWYQGVKISLFDVSDVTAPKEVAKYEIGDRGTDSPILSDHKAFLFDKARNLLVIPVTVAEINPAKYPNGVPPNAYGDFVWDGAYVFHVSLEEGLVLKGRITHLDDNSELLKSGYYFSSQYSIRRSLYIEDVLYTISDRKIKMNALSDLSEINELDINP